MRHIQTWIHMSQVTGCIAVLPDRRVSGLGSQLHFSWKRQVCASIRMQALVSMLVSHQMSSLLTIPLTSRPGQPL